MDRLSLQLAAAMNVAPEKLPRCTKDKTREMLRKKLPANLDKFRDLSPREFCFLRNLFATHPRMSYQAFRAFIEQWD